jgi:predicted transcriptional regulator
VTPLENIRQIHGAATSRGDAAVSVYASLSEALILLKTSRGTPEMIQNCMAQAAKYQFDPQVKIPQLEVMSLLVSFLASLHQERQEETVEKLRALQKKMDECQDWGEQTEFLLPIRKQSNTSAHTVGGDTSAIIRPGENAAEFDYLVMSFMTHMELSMLMYVSPSFFHMVRAISNSHYRFAMGGLTYLHKTTSANTQPGDLWQEGLKILAYCTFWLHLHMSCF